MDAFDNIDVPPRRTMTLYFLVDTSGSMAGEKIGSVNVAAQDSIRDIREISSGNADAIIKVAALEFSSGTEWMYPQPIEAQDFEWRDLEAGGLTCLGEAYTELNNKLSKTHGFMNEAMGSFAPVIILLSDGEPVDDYQRALAKLKGNGWFNSAIKIAIAVGDDANKNILAEFTGNSEAVLTVHNREQLKKIIHFVSVTPSRIASQNGSVGKDAPETKQEEVIQKIKETIKEDPAYEGVDIGTETSGCNDNWDAFNN